MTTQDLVIGHFDGALSPEQEMQLQQMLGESPEARSLFEQHRAIHGMMEEEAETLAPSSALDDATLGAAIGLLASEIAAGGLGLSFAAKIAAAVSIGVVGGMSVGVMLDAGPAAKSANPLKMPVPAVETVDGTTAPQPPSMVEETVAPENGGGEPATANTAASEVDTAVETAGAAQPAASPATANRNTEPSTSGNSSTTASSSNGFGLGTEEPVQIEPPVTVSPDNN